MDIRSFFPAMKTVSVATGELAGPCPVCGGKDRFHVWPDAKTGFHYKCRQCDAKGNAISFLRDFHGIKNDQARMMLGLPLKTVGSDSKRRIAFRRCCPGPSISAKPQQQIAPPSETWQQCAAQFLDDVQKALVCDGARQFLARRGIALETAQRCGLGWNDHERWIEHHAWGTQKDGKFKIPPGLVIANKRQGKVISLTIRQLPGNEPKYWQIAGSMECNAVFGRPGIPVMILESTLDAILIRQESGFQLATIGMFGASKPFDAAAAQVAREAPLVLLCPDADESGAAALEKWKAKFPKARAWLPKGAKDPGEMLQAGIDLASWIKEGMGIVLSANSEWGSLPDKYPYKILCAYPGSSSEESCDWQTPDERKASERRYHIYDRRGMGIDASGLPSVLAGFSATGWRLELSDDDRIMMVKATEKATNEDGNSAYLQVLMPKILNCLRCLSGKPVQCPKGPEAAV